MPYSIPAVGAEGDPGFLAWASAMRTSLLDLEARVLELEGGSGFVGPLDEFAVPHRAHSFRRLLASYTGPAIKVRRSTDNVEYDIGFTLGGDLDEADLLAKIGSASAYMVTWYDQSGNGRHLTQATAAAQPRIVNAGVVEVRGSKPACRLDGTDDYMTSTSVGLAAGTATIATVLEGAVNNMASSVVLAESTSTSGNGYLRFIRTSSANWNVQATSSTTSWWASTITGSNLFDLSRHQAFYSEASSVINTWKDGTVVHSAVAAPRTGGGVMTPDRFALGAGVGTSVGGFFNGWYQEVIGWASDMTASRAAISAEQKAYWGTP